MARHYKTTHGSNPESLKAVGIEVASESIRGEKEMSLEGRHFGFQHLE